MAVKLLFNGIPQFEDSSGNPYSSARLFFYAAGSSTKQNTYSDSAGLVANSNPVTLNSSGYPAVSGSIVQIWGTVGQTYKIGFAAPGSDDPPASFIWTSDNVSPINDTTTSIDQWVASGLTPTFVSTTSFTLSGDQTSTFHVGRRLKTTNSGGTIYSTITDSSHAAGTTTVTVTNDSGSLDSGLSAVSYAQLSSTNQSVPGLSNSGDIPILSALGTLRGASASPFPINLTLEPSVAGNALTITIKGRNGAAPSPSNPVLVPFRNVTAGTGDYAWLVLTSATSFTVSSGSTLGAIDNVPFRLWVVAFNDGSTFRLGVINCVSSTASNGAGRDINSIFRLGGFRIASSTAEGGAGAADSAQTFYTGTAVTSRAYTVLGYLAWESGLATAGTWNAAPTRSQLFVPGVPLPGEVIQVQRTDNTSGSTGTGTTPLDDTIPQNTEGNEFMTQAITPSSTANALRVDTQMVVGSSIGTGAIIGHLHQDTTANALAVSGVQHDGAANDWTTLRIQALKVASTTSATTFKARAGASAAATTTFNGRAGARLFGGVANSFLEVAEIMT